MSKESTFARALFVLLVGAVLIAGSEHLHAQDLFKPGDKVEYKESDYSDWKEGTVVRPLPGNTQLLIRSKPDPYFKDGLEQAIVFSRIRRPAVTAVVPIKTIGEAMVDNKGGTVAPPISTANGLMTKEEIFSFLRTQLPKAPDDPNSRAVSKQLVDEIKRRGVQYFDVKDADIYNVFLRYDPRDAPIVSAIRSNYGAPPRQSWLMGRWNLMVAVTGYNYSKGALAGFVTINENGTYQWKPRQNDPVINGRWRAATSEEMWFQGGAGIVLLKGEGGDDWIARKSVNREFNGDHIDIALLDMTYRGGQRRTGKR